MRLLSCPLRFDRIATLRGLLLSFVLTVLSPSLRAEVKLPHIFSDNMVIQRAKPVPVWGWAESGETVTVTFAGQTKTATANRKGKWLLKLDPLKASSTPQQFVVKGPSNTVTFNNVVIGEVWLCSGQSNMEMHVARSKDGDIELPAANYPGIRVMTIPHRSITTPQENFPVENSGGASERKGEWLVCTPETAGRFPAVGYYFARQVHQILKVPLGLIDNSWGGSSVETWISRPTLETIPAAAKMLKYWDDRIAAWSLQEAEKRYKASLAKWEQRVANAKAEGKRPPGKPRIEQDPASMRNNPAGCYNGAIAPIAKFAIRGAIFYQGESNAIPGWPSMYAKTFPALITDWRRAFGDDELPFYICQISTWGRSASEISLEEAMLSPAALIRETHLKTHLSTPHTALIVTFDVGHHNIHPPNKQDVGKRVARWALAKQYGMTDIAYTGPLYKSMTREGNKIIIHFQPLGPRWSRMTESCPEETLKGFVIAGADKKFYPARARCVGETVEVWSDQVNDPVAVRYAWATFPVGNLVGGQNLPASPFRTDDWPILQDAPFDSSSKEYQEWNARKYQRLLQAREDARQRRAKEARKTLQELNKDRK